MNVVSPGPVKTPGLGGQVAEEERKGLFDALAAQVPLGRIGEPAEVGKTVAFLASDAASFINAIELLLTVVWRRFKADITPSIPPRRRVFNGRLASRSFNFTV